MGRKLKAALGTKGLLCIASLITIALALVYYSATVTITPKKIFTVGATSHSWTVYVNDENEIRYLPSNASTPAGSFPPNSPSISDPNTYAFYVSTEADKACAVNITMSTPADSSKFSKFEVTVKQWVPATSSWANTLLYNAPTGGSIKSFIDGTTNDYGYVQHPVSTNTYYLICVTYSYDLVDTTDLVTVTFQYTPLPQLP